MESLAKRGAKIPDDVLEALDLAIALRDDANAFYRDMHAALEMQHRHWFVCKLLRYFRRLFRRRATTAPGDPAKPEPRAGTLGFEALEIEQPADVTDANDDDVSPLSSNVLDIQEETPEDERVFALACLMADAARAREEVRTAWAAWTIDAGDHCASLLGATCQANHAVMKLDKIVNGTQLDLGLPDTTLATLLSCAPPPRVRLRLLQARSELNGRRGTLGARDAATGRYAVTLDGDGAELVRAKPANVCPEFGWKAGADAMVGILQEVGRAVEAFSRAAPTSADLLYCEDHTTQLAQFATKGAMHAWRCYGEGNGNLTTNAGGIRDAAWRVALRAFHKEPRRPSFTFAFMLLCAVDCNVDAAKRLEDRLAANPPLVMEELKAYHARVVAGVGAVGQTKEMQEPGSKRLMESFWGVCEAVDMMREAVILTTVQSCPWLAGDVLYTGGALAATLTSNVMWVHRSHLRVMVHVYHALRCRGRLRAIPEVDATVRVFRRSVFFRLEQLPSKGSFCSALKLSIGMSVAANQPDKVQQIIGDHTGCGLSEMSTLYFLATFAGAGLDLSSLDFPALARADMAVLHRAPHLLGAAQLLAVEDRLGLDGCLPQLVMRAADTDGPEWERVAERVVACFEANFPGCGYSPPAPEAPVPLTFSGHAHVAPMQGQAGMHASSYAPTDERRSRDAMKAELREGVARAKAAGKAERRAR